jgi:hypothetical protein
MELALESVFDAHSSQDSIYVERDSDSDTDDVTDTVFVH